MHYLRGFSVFSFVGVLFLYLLSSSALPAVIYLGIEKIISDDDTDLQKDRMSHMYSFSEYKVSY